MKRPARRNCGRAAFFPPLQRKHNAMAIRQGFFSDVGGVADRVASFFDGATRTGTVLTPNGTASVAASIGPAPAGNEVTAPLVSPNIVRLPGGVPGANSSEAQNAIKYGAKPLPANAPATTNQAMSGNGAISRAIAWVGVNKKLVAVVILGGTLAAYLLRKKG